MVAATAQAALAAILDQPTIVRPFPDRHVWTLACRWHTVRRCAASPAGKLTRCPACPLLFRHVDGLPVATLGDATVDGLRRLLAAAGAKPGGPRHIVVTDLREELVL